MTLVEPTAVAGPARTAVGEWGSVPWADRVRRAWRAPLTEHLVVLASVVAVVGPLARSGGGRDAGALAWSAPLVLVALAVTRPWRRIDPRGLALVAAVAVAALAVLVLTGGGRAGAVAAAGYGSAPRLRCRRTAYARSRTRRAVVAAVLCAGAVAQFGWALVPWWGGADPSRPMVGTFDWHNQYAAALLAPALRRVRAAARQPAALARGRLGGGPARGGRRRAVHAAGPRWRCSRSAGSSCSSSLCSRPATGGRVGRW